MQHLHSDPDVLTSGCLSALPPPDPKRRGKARKDRAGEHGELRTETNPDKPRRHNSSWKEKGLLGSVVFLNQVTVMTPYSNYSSLGAKSAEGFLIMKHEREKRPLFCSGITSP